MDNTEKFVFTPKFGSRNNNGALLFGTTFKSEAQRGNSGAAFHPIQKSSDFSGAFFRVALVAFALVIGYMVMQSFYSDAPSFSELMDSTTHDISTIARSFGSWLSDNIDWLNRELF